VACVPTLTLTRTPPPAAQALSLLGDTLWNAPVPTLEQQHRLRALLDARRRLAAQPTDINTKLLVARRTAEMGRLREAISLYTEAIAEQPTGPRQFRRRGELLLLTREVDQAIRDLRRAEGTLAGDSGAKEFTELPSGEMMQSSLLHATRWLLGVAYYVRGDHAAARKAFTRSLEVAGDADEVAAGALWLFFTLRREKRMSEAVLILRAVPGSLPVLKRSAELNLLRLFKGEITVDTLRTHSITDGPLDEREPLYFYGLGFARLVQGRPDEAAELFHQAMSGGLWTAIPYLAAEAEVARIRYQVSGIR